MDMLNNNIFKEWNIIGGQKNYKIGNKCFGVTFDPDSSPDTWMTFLKRYDDILTDGEVKLCPGEEIYHFSPMERWNASGKRNRNKRIRYNYQLDSELSVNLAGDCDFNFRKTRFTKFEMIIKQSNLHITDKLRLLNKLYYSNAIHHTHLNFSLFPVSFNLQSLKGRSDDRLDLFLVELKQYYSNNGKQSDIYESSSGELRMYFDSFETFEEYLKRIYHIDATEHDKFVDKLLSMPKKISTTDELENYLDIVSEYWELRMEYFKTLSYN